MIIRDNSKAFVKDCRNQMRIFELKSHRAPFQIKNDTDLAAFVLHLHSVYHSDSKSGSVYVVDARSTTATATTTATAAVGTHTRGTCKHAAMHQMSRIMFKSRQISHMNS